MSNHEMNYDEGVRRTALNDDSIYKLEQAKWRKELKGFYWCGEDLERVETGVLEGVREMDTDGEEVEIESGLTSEVGDVDTEFSEDASVADGEVNGEVQHGGERPPTESDADITISQDMANMVLAQMVESPVIGLQIPRSGERGASPTMDSPSLPVLPSSATAPSTPPPASMPSPQASTAPLGRVDAGGLSDTPPSPMTIPSVMERSSLESTPSTQHDSPQPAISLKGYATTPPAESPKLSLTSPVRIAPKTRSPARAIHHLPSGLPASGLSVSDIVSIPSPGLEAPNRLIRRHPTIQSIDSHLPRLSVEMNGTFAHLDDEDWEELELDAGNIQSMPNGHPGIGLGAPSSFLNRVLRKRPSTLAMSNLRRQPESSDSSVENVSPTKLKPALFTGKGTKKAFEKIKAFPRLRKVTGSASIPHGVIPSSSSSSGVSSRVIGNGNGNGNNNGGRGTENGWLAGKGRSISGLGAGLAKNGLGMGRAVSAGGKKRAGSDDSVGSGGVPRVELRETPPVVWEI
jgi:protein-serine/threonine kinase